MHLNVKICALLALCVSAGAQAASNWQVLKVGSGGFVRGLAVAPDGTMVVHTDTNGAYLWKGSSWVQLVNSSSMPAALIAENPVQFGQGVYEIQAAPSNTSILYMLFDGYVFRSTNQGTTWTQTAFTQDTAGTNPNDAYGQVAQKMAVDPNNPNIVYVGTEDHGLYVTTNGGTSWSVAPVPTGTAAGISGILFYPGGGAAGGVTQVIYACSNSHGVYASTNGGASWTGTAGGPTTVSDAAIDTSGNYYAVSGQGLWKYSGGKWTELYTDNNSIQAVAVNPFNQSEVVAVRPSGWVNVSYNGGSTWSGANYETGLVSTDIPWLVNGNQSNQGIYLDSGGLAFSPVTNGQLVLSAGTGVWNMSVPPSGVTPTTPLTWTDMSLGIEQLVANAIVVPPVSGSSPILASWDRPFFKITNPNAYPSTYGPVQSSNIVAGWSLDYASSNPSFVVGIAEGNGGEESGYSTDGGSTWTRFASAPAPSGLTGGTIAASTPQNIIWAPASGRQPYYTLNQGATWSGITLPGVSGWGGFDYAYYLVQRSVTADRVNPNTFYLYFPGHGVFQTSNGGVTWTNVYSGNSGHIESNASYAGYNSTLSSVPGNAGHLFYTSGPQSGSTASSPANNPLFRSTNGGATWTAVANVLAVSCFGFGAAAPGQSYPAIYIVGYVNKVFGIWQSVDNATTWTNIGTYPVGELDGISTISGDPNNYGAVYVGFGGGGGYAYLPAGGSSAQLIPMAPANLVVH